MIFLIVVVVCATNLSHEYVCVKHTQNGNFPTKFDFCSCATRHHLMILAVLLRINFILELNTSFEESLYSLRLILRVFLENSHAV